MDPPNAISKAREVICSDVFKNERIKHTDNFLDLLRLARYVSPQRERMRILKREFDHGLQLLQERMFIGYVMSDSQDLMHMLRETESLNMDKFLANLTIEPSPDYDQNLEITGPHRIGDTLQEYHRSLSYHLYPETTLDVLIRDQIATGSDENFVMKGKSHEERNNNILAALSTSPPNTNMGGFLKHVKEANTNLGEKVHTSYHTTESRHHLCAARTVITLVDPCRIADTLLEIGAIPRTFYTDLMRLHVTSEKKWNYIISKGLEKEAIFALKPKFKHFFNMFETYDLKCTCVKREYDKLTAQHIGMTEQNERKSMTSSITGWSAKSSGTGNAELAQTLSGINNSLGNISKWVESQKQAEGNMRPVSMINLGSPIPEVVADFYPVPRTHMWRNSWMHAWDPEKRSDRKEANGDKKRGLFQRFFGKKKK